jgi:hypothetical protein
MKEYNKNGNNKVYSPSGVLMFLTSEKRINWYLNRNLAEIIENNGESCSIRLKFEPNGLGHNGDEFYLIERSNVCVVCGSTDHEKLTKHHVVPHIYRKFFPLKLKDRSSYDILLICEDCHYAYEKEAYRFKTEIARMYGVPTIDECCKTDIKIGRARAIANSILLHCEKIPMEKLIDMYVNFSRLTGLVPSARTLKKYKCYKQLKGSDVESLMHGKLVVDKITDFQNFSEMWRKHFLDNAKPKFMPDKWTLDKPICKI